MAHARDVESRACFRGASGNDGAELCGKHEEHGSDGSFAVTTETGAPVMPFWSRRLRRKRVLVAESETNLMPMAVFRPCTHGQNQHDRPAAGSIGWRMPESMQSFYRFSLASTSVSVSALWMTLRACVELKPVLRDLETVVLCLIKGPFYCCNTPPASCLITLSADNCRCKWS